LKHKYIFFTWLLANLFLSLIFMLHSHLNGDFSNFGTTLFTIFIWFIISIPSLTVLLVAVFDYNKKAGEVSFKKYFSKKIIHINIFYFLCSTLFLSSKPYFLPSTEELFYLAFFYTITTLAGLASLWIVNKKIK
jgi:hypothetical protein